MATVDLACKWKIKNCSIQVFVQIVFSIKKIAFIIFLALRLKYRSEKDKFLEENIAVKEPFHLFKSWLNEAVETPEILEPNAFCLSTVSK